MVDLLKQALANWQNLEIVCLEGHCPACERDDVAVIECPTDDEIFFECLDCGWNSTFSLSDAREAGYYPEQPFDSD